MQAVSGENRGARFAALPHVGEADHPEGEIPWSSAAAWRECRLSLEMTIAAAGAGLDPARAMASRIVHCYDLAGDLFDALERVTNDNANGEYYVTDVPALLLSDGKRVSVIDAVPAEDVLSINTPEHLAEVDRILRERLGKGVIP